jgi:hypothetical protein
MSHMLTLHPAGFLENIVNYPASAEFVSGLSVTKVTSQFLTGIIVFLRKIIIF